MSDGGIAMLNTAFAVPGAVTFLHSPLGGPVARLTHHGGTADVALWGAQVLAWTLAGAQPVIWLSPSARLDTGREVRGGVPVCWPWFGTHPLDRAKRSHGFARTRVWEVVHAAATAVGVELRLRLPIHVDDAAVWPHVATCEIEITLGADLEIELTTQNIGPAPFLLTAALHTYFAISDVGHVLIEGLEGLDYLDKVEGFARHRQSGPIGLEDQTDRVYLGHTGPCRILDRGLKRQITIGKRGSRATVVWNPWAEVCARLGDMGADGYRGMVCVETANAGDDLIELAPQAVHELTQKISVAPM